MFAAAPSKVPYYIAGGVLALWAVVLAVWGISHAEFPGSQGRGRLVMLTSFVLVVATMTAAVVTAGEHAQEGAKAAGVTPRATGRALQLAADPGGALRFDKNRAAVLAGRVAVRFRNQSKVAHNVTIAHKEHLRRLAVHDDALLEVIAVEGGAFATSVMDERTAALVRVAATIAVDAAPSSFQHAVALALAAGATSDQIVASLEAVTPVTGAARVVQCAPKLALALGYDVEAALELLDR